MLEGEEGGSVVVEHDVRVALELLVSGDGDDGDAEGFVEGGVDEKEAVDGALGEEAWVLFDEVGLALMGDNVVEVPGLEQSFFDAVHERGEGLAGAEGAGDGVGAIVETLGCFEDALARGGGDG
jgi:hypothetical protein